MQRFNRISDVLILGVALVSLAGCGATSTLARYHRGQDAGNLGAASEVVFTPTPAFDGWEYGRLDQALSLRSSADLAQEDAQRPSLSNLRRMHLHPRPDLVYYYDASRPRRH